MDDEPTYCTMCEGTMEPSHHEVWCDGNYPESTWCGYCNAWTDHSSFDHGTELLRQDADACEQHYPESTTREARGAERTLDCDYCKRRVLFAVERGGATLYVCGPHVQEALQELAQ